MYLFSDEISNNSFLQLQITELNTHLQGMSAIVAEKNREISELRRDRDRHLSQNRLAALKATGSNNPNRLSY
jgi:hypothetical protein